MSSAAIVQKFWNYCNVLCDDGISAESSWVKTYKDGQLIIKS